MKVGMGLIFVCVVLFMSEATAIPNQNNAQKRKQLEYEIAETLKAGVLRELSALAEAGRTFPRKEAYALLTKISMQEMQKQRHKISQLAHLMVDPDYPKAARNISINLKAADIKQMYEAIVRREEGELSLRAAGAVSNFELDANSRQAEALLYKMLSQ